MISCDLPILSTMINTKNIYDLKLTYSDIGQNITKNITKTIDIIARQIRSATDGKADVNQKPG